MMKININQVIYLYITTFVLSCILGFITVPNDRILLFTGCLFLVFAAPAIHYSFEFKAYVNSLEENNKDDENSEQKNEYHIYDNFSNGYAVCGIYNTKSETTKFNFIGKNGKLLLDNWCDIVTRFYNCGVAVIGNINHDEQLQFYKIIDKSGKPINSFEYLKVDTFSDDGIAKVTSRDGKINYVNISGEHLLEEWKDDDSELIRLTVNEE